MAARSRESRMYNPKATTATAVITIAADLWNLNRSISHLGNGTTAYASRRLSRRGPRIGNAALTPHKMMMLQATTCRIGRIG
jgi:hypothetical protein